MNTLVINTAFSKTYVALSSSLGKFYSSLDSCSKQSENVLVCIDELLSLHSISIKDISTLGVVVGPGSFTGIRIGVALAKGMASAKDINLISICSLDLMAYKFAKCNLENNFTCILNALSGYFYICHYNKNGKPLSKPELITTADINKNEQYVGEINENLLFCENFIEFDSESLLELTLLYLNQNKIVSEPDLLPIYLRKSQAEENL